MPNTRKLLRVRWLFPAGLLPSLPKLAMLLFAYRSMLRASFSLVSLSDTSEERSSSSS